MSANYREPQFLLPNCKNLKLPGTGTSIGSGLTADRHSLYSMDFGAADYINVGSSTELDNVPLGPYSISFWLKFTSTANMVVSEKRAANTWVNAQFAVHLGGTGHAGELSWFGGAGGGTPIFSSSTLNDGNWHHIALVAESTTVSKVYIDGSLDTTSSTNRISSSVVTGTFNIGTNYITSYGFSGDLDEYAIFSRALSSNEVNTLWNNGAPYNPMLLSGKPVAYYPLGEQARNPNGNSDWRFPNEVLQGQAINFDGTDYIEISKDDALGFVGTDFSISIWLNPSVSHNGLVMMNYDGNGGWGVYYNSGNIRFYDTPTWTTLTNIPTGKWSHILIVGDNTGNNLICYRNGIQVYNSSRTFTITETTRNTFIGSEAGTKFYFNGKLSNIALWNSNQSANKDNIYNYGAPQTSYTVTPTAWYKLDKTSKFTGLNPNWHSALDFNSSQNDYIAIQNSSSLTNGFSELTVSIWANFSSTGTSQQQIISKDGNSQRSWILRKLSSGVNFLVSTDGTSASQTLFYPNASITIGEWYHFVGVYDGSKLLLYVNGVLIDDSVSLTGSLPSTTSDVFIGTYDYSNNFTFDGKLSNAAIFNQAISAEDVKYLYNGGTPQTNISFEPTSWYKLDNLTTGIQDSGSASNNGTNNGATEVASNVAIDEWVFENTVQSQTPNWSSALDFNGTSDHITLPTITLADDWSVSVWMKLPQAKMRTQPVGTSTGSGFFAYGGLIRSGGSLTSNLTYYTGSSIVKLSDISFDDGQWHHWIITYNNSTTTLKCFVDGEETYNDTYDAGTGNTINRISNNFASNYWQGELSNIAIFNTDLDAAAISTIYNNGQPETTISSSPVSWWKLDNTTTGIQDSVGSNNGTNNGATEIQTNVWTPRLNGESDTLPSTALVSSDLQFNSAYSSFSLNFDGSGNVVNLGNTDSLKLRSGDFTFSVWINPDSWGSSYKGIYVNNNTNGVFIGKGSGNEFVLRIFNVSNIISYSTLPSINTWTHICITRNNGLCSLFYNGSSVATATSTHDFSGSSDVFIGSDNAGAHFDGKLDELSIFNKALSQAEITSIYNNGYPKDITALAPVSWYRLGEDAYFNGNDFIITNQITGAPNGTSNGMPATALVADAPGSYAAGLGSSLALADRVGDAPNSTANSLSFNMTPENRISYPAGYTPTQVDNVYSMEFDGAGDYITLASGNYGFPSLTANGQTLDNLSISVWFKSQGGSGNQVLLTWWASGTGSQPYLDAFLSYNPSNRVVRFGDSWPNAYTLPSAATNWTHIVAVKTTSNAYIYVNGSLVSTKGSSLSFGFNRELRIGGNQGSGEWFNGKIDEVALFDYALSERQIKQDIYKGTTSGKTADLNNISNLTPPVAWYRMGD